MFCRKCGNEINDEDLFCAQCGATVSRLSNVDPEEDQAHENAPSSHDSPEAALDERGGDVAPLSTDQLDTEMLPCTAAKTKQRTSQRTPLVVLAVLVVALAVGAAAWASRPIDGGTDTGQVEAQQQEEAQDTPATEQEAFETEIVEQPQTETENKQDSENETSKEPAYGHEAIEIQVTMPIEPITDPGASASFTWSYPRFTCTQDSEHVDRINERFESEVQQQATNSETWTLDNIQSAQCLNLEYTVTYQEGPIVSVKEWRYETLWGAHGNHHVSGSTYDLSTGEFINPGSIFGLNRQETIDLAAEAVRSFIKNNPDKHSLPSSELIDKAVADISGRTDCMYITSDGLVVHSQDYDLGGWSPYYEIIVKPFNENIPAGTLSQKFDA